MRIQRSANNALVGLILLGVAGCAGGSVGPRPYQSFAAHHYSPPPGPPGDPWGPYIHEAASRFRVPEQWIRAVMRQESGGQEDITSSAGAMGLMQVMPATYAQLAAQYGLGNDPYEPHDNMMAGTAYLRQMFDRYGSPGFLAAYNAGPGRMDSYLSGGSDLPDETVNYVAAIAPHLGSSVASSTVVAANGCDRNVAYDPTRPCRPPRVVTAVAAPMSPKWSTSVSSLPAPILVNAPPCNPDAAYDPTRTCQDVPSPVATSVLASAAPPCDPNAPYDPRKKCRPVPQAPDPPPLLQLASAEASRPMTVSFSPPAPRPSTNVNSTKPSQPNNVPATGIWAIEVGVFANSAMAGDVAAAARSSLPELLAGARIAVAPTAPLGGTALYRARLTALSLLAARSACGKLAQRGLGCTLVLPGPGG